MARVEGESDDVERGKEQLIGLADLRLELSSQLACQSTGEGSERGLQMLASLSSPQMGVVLH